VWSPRRRFVLHLAAQRGFFFVLYCIYFAVTAALGLLSLAHWPGRESMEQRSPQEAGYQVGSCQVARQASWRSSSQFYKIKNVTNVTKHTASRLRLTLVMRPDLQQLVDLATERQDGSCKRSQLCFNRTSAQGERASLVSFPNARSRGFSDSECRGMPCSRCQTRRRLARAGARSTRRPPPISGTLSPSAGCRPS